MCTELGGSQVEVQSCIAQGRRQKDLPKTQNFFHGGFCTQTVPHANGTEKERNTKRHRKGTKKYILWRFWFQWLKNPNKYLRTVLFHPSCLWCQEIRFFLLYKKTNMFFYAEKCWHTSCFKRRIFYVICVSNKACKGFMRRKCLLSSKPCSFFFSLCLHPEARILDVFSRLQYSKIFLSSKQPWFYNNFNH